MRGQQRLLHAFALPRSHTLDTTVHHTQPQQETHSHLACLSSRWDPDIFQALGQERQWVVETAIVCSIQVGNTQGGKFVLFELGLTVGVGAKTLPMHIE